MLTELSRAQRTLSETLKNFDFKCIGNGQTDEEVCIQRSLLEFGRLISSIEDQRDMMVRDNPVCSMLANLYFFKCFVNYINAKRCPNIIEKNRRNI